MSAVREALSAVKRNPVIIVVTLLAGVLQIPQLVGQYLDSVVAVAVMGVFSLVYLLFLPFYYGGVIGMASEALHGETSFRTFLREGRANYVSLFGAYVLLVVLLVVYLVVLAITGGIGGMLAFAVGSADFGAGSLLITGAVVLLLVLLLFGFVFFTQFFGQAIVLDDRSAVGGFRGSVSAVRGNKLSTLGYMVIVVIASTVFGALAGVVAVLPAMLETQNVFVVAALSSIALVIVTGIVGAFAATYGVAFYEGIRTTTEQDSGSHGSSSEDSVSA